MKTAKLINPTDTEKAPVTKEVKVAKPKPAPLTLPVKVAKEPKEPKEPKAPKPQVIIQQVKAKRAPSQYNLFIADKCKGDKMTMKEATSLWNEQKSK